MITGVADWDADRFGAISLQAIAKHFASPAKYRLAERRYPAGEEVMEITRDASIFVVGGAINIRANDGEASLESGQYANLSEGTYFIRSLTAREALIVFAWLLPPKFRRH
ncbi:MAG: hypothetical protein QNJ00_00700 [Woeseiaceae bacterium]|nr:hypothetical protein [Woeseiaceae bacterium]